MLTWISNMLTNPRQSLLKLAVAIVLLAAVVFSPSTMAAVAGIFVIGAVLLMCHVPFRIIWPLCCGAVMVAGAVSVVTGALSAGVLPLLSTGVVAVGVARLWTLVFRAPPKPRGARWATIRDLRRAGFLGTHGFPLGTVDGHTIRLPEELERQSILVTATTGSGKTSVVVIPPLIEETQRPADALRSIVALDPKDEVARSTMATLSRTHRVLLWDPSDPSACTVGLDPLATLPPPTDDGFVAEVKSVAQSFFWASRGGHQTTDPFWINQPRALMEGLFLTFVVTHPRGTFVELADWTRSLTIETFCEVLDRTAHPTVQGYARMAHALSMADKAASAIWSDVLQRFDVLDDPRVRRSMSGPPVDRSFVTQPTALYLRVAAQDAERLGPLLSMAMGQLYRELTKIAALSPGGKLERDVRFYIDEFGSLPRIYGIENALATLRSRGVGHALFVQSTSQLADHYGRQLAETIQDNLVTRIILGGAAYGDAKAFSDRCGDIVEYFPAKSETSQGLFRSRSRNRSYSAERRPLISPWEIIHLRDTVLVSTRGISPIRLTAQPFYAQPAMVARMQADQAAFPPANVPAVCTSPAPLPAARPPTVPPGSRDVPPPGCSPREWDCCAASLRVARWSMEDDLLDLVTGKVADIQQLRERWRMDTASSTPARYAKVTPADRANCPNVSTYIDELALRLELREEEGGAV